MVLVLGGSAADSSSGRGNERLKIPDVDLWLFDSRTPGRMHFDNSDSTVGVELIEGGPETLAACRARDALMPFALPTAEVWAQVQRPNPGVRRPAAGTRRLLDELGRRYRGA
ncbi:DUF6879 family protein [Streptomyces sp. NPDC088182]|uniref:DUF6879 family protein n=1 Tax=Streptomyces sp. NPDC088182 TaxID=3365838 RepID=UPI00382317D0